MSRFADKFLSGLDKFAEVVTDQERLSKLVDKGLKHAHDEVIGEHHPLLGCADTHRLLRLTGIIHPNR